MWPITTKPMSTTGPSTATSSASAASSAPPTPPSTQSRPSMASDTASTPSDDEADLRLSWSGRWTLGYRILAVNIITVLLIALSTLYLDVFRHRLHKERTQQTRIETQTAAIALAHVGQRDWPALLASMSTTSGDRFRLYGPDGALLIDSWKLTGPTYELIDPKEQRWTK